MSVLDQTPLAQILVIEDEPEIRELITLHLHRQKYQVLEASSAEEGFRLLEENPSIDLIVLDWMLPGSTGPEFAKRLRRTPTYDDLAILMVTARAEAADIVLGLEAGADDYLSKPFEPVVLLARVTALLRRQKRPAIAMSPETSSETVQLGPLMLSPQSFEVKCEEEPISLTPSEFKLLLALAHHRGRVLTRDALIQYVQGEGVSVVGRTVDTHVFGLRKKLGACADVIETVRGIGYRIKSGEL